jgi:hypothetical protein
MPIVRRLGGLKIYGGWIWQTDISGSVQAESPFAVSGYWRRIPIRQCRFIEQQNEHPLFIAGLLGKPTMRRVSVQSQFAFSIWFDADNVLEIAGPRPSFRQLDPFQLVFLAGYDFVTQQYFKAYYSPRCTAETITPIWDNEAKPKKIIGVEVVGRSRGWDFILPDDGDPANAQTPVGAYMQYLRTNGGRV